jgi:TonB family protein
MVKCTLIAIVVIVTTLAAQEPYTPARYAGGAPPVLPALTVGGGQAFLELTIRSNGTVESVRPIRSTPPFTQVLSDAVAGWRFTPALEAATDADGKPIGPSTVSSKVMVASMFRAPTLLTPTLGEKPADVGAPSADVAYPSSIQEPPFPPRALAAGVVLIEASVDISGNVANARVIASSPAFDQAALDTARRWRFKPALIKGRAMPTYAYLVFGFPQPITGG